MRSRRSFLVILLGLVAAWALVLCFRWELRARWWAYRITHAQSVEDRRFYLVRLAAIGDRSLGSLPALLDDTRPEIRSLGITVLTYCPSEAAAAHLLKLLEDEDSDVASVAANSLAWRPGAGRYVSRLGELLHGSDSPSAWAAAIALGRIGGKDAEHLLFQSLARPVEPDLCAQLIDSLGLLGCQAAVPAMIEALSDQRTIQRLPNSQSSAARAIQSLQQELITKGTDPQALLGASTTPPLVASVAARWLALLTGADFGDPATQPAEQTTDLQRRWRQATQPTPASGELRPKGR